MTIQVFLFQNAALTYPNFEINEFVSFDMLNMKYMPGHFTNSVRSVGCSERIPVLGGNFSCARHRQQEHRLLHMQRIDFCFTCSVNLMAEII